jgi:hypothetical protein
VKTQSSASSSLISGDQSELISSCMLSSTASPNAPVESAGAELRPSSPVAPCLFLLSSTEQGGVFLLHGSSPLAAPPSTATWNTNSRSESPSSICKVRPRHPPTHTRPHHAEDARLTHLRAGRKPFCDFVAAVERVARVCGAATHLLASPPLADFPPAAGGTTAPFGRGGTVEGRQIGVRHADAVLQTGSDEAGHIALGHGGEAHSRVRIDGLESGYPVRRRTQECYRRWQEPFCKV